MVLLALAVLFGFIGCGDDSSSGGGGNSGSGGGSYPVTYTKEGGGHTLTVTSSTTLMFDTGVVYSYDSGNEWKVPSYDYYITITGIGTGTIKVSSPTVSGHVVAGGHDSYYGTYTKQ